MVILALVAIVAGVLGLSGVAAVAGTGASILFWALVILGLVGLFAGCAFHAIRPLIPLASGRSFQEHPATSRVGLRGSPSLLIAVVLVKGLGGAQGCPREGPARPAPRPPTGWR